MYYKNIMDENIIKFNRDMRKKMKYMRVKNSKEFWKILNQDRKREKSKISLETLFHFFLKI